MRLSPEIDLHDPVQAAEIELLMDLMIAATGRTNRIDHAELDELLGAPVR